MGTTYGGKTASLDGNGLKGSLAPHLLAAMLAVTAAGCTHINEGAVSSQHGALSKDNTRVIGEPGARFFPPTDRDGLSLIEEGQGFSVNILSAYICNFHEFGWRDLTLSARGSKACDNGSGDGGGSAATRGEIALVANVVERTSSEANTRNISAKGPGRVVFYSEDIRESGQLLNALNIPVHGPIKYKGAPLHMELAILELDNEENEDTRIMLKSLAALGSSAYPPSSAALSILSTLGGALLAGDQDDIEFRHRLEFDRSLKGSNGQNIRSQAHRMPLAEGYYAFIRAENRSEDPKYQSWKVCRSMGALVTKDSYCPKTNTTRLPEDQAPQGKDKEIKYYRTSTWVLVRVSRESDLATDEIEVGELLAEFTERNAEAAAKARKDIEIELLKANEAIAIKKRKDADPNPN